jgi:hypothetical protein
LCQRIDFRLEFEGFGEHRLRRAEVAFERQRPGEAVVELSQSSWLASGRRAHPRGHAAAANTLPRPRRPPHSVFRYRGTAADLRSIPGIAAGSARLLNVSPMAVVVALAPKLIIALWRLFCHYR